MCECTCRCILVYVHINKNRAPLIEKHVSSVTKGQKLCWKLFRNSYKSLFNIWTVIVDWLLIIAVSASVYGICLYSSQGRLDPQSSLPDSDLVFLLTRITHLSRRAPLTEMWRSGVWISATVTAPCLLMTTGNALQHWPKPKQSCVRWNKDKFFFITCVVMESFSRLSSFQLWLHLLWSGTLIHVQLTRTALWLHTSCSFISPLICFLMDHLTFCPWCCFLVLFSHFAFASFSAFLLSLSALSTSSFISVFWFFWAVFSCLFCLMTISWVSCFLSFVFFSLFPTS